jgi:hypothetical protein
MGALISLADAREVWEGDIAAGLTKLEVIKVTVYYIYLIYKL